MNVLLVLLVGLLTGWVAAWPMKSSEVSLPGNLAMGVWGAAIGTLLFDLLGLYSYSLIGSLAMAVVGSMLVQSLVSRIEIG